MEPSAIARQVQNHQKLNSRVAKENDMMLGTLISQKSGIDLMQNCDLPPPLKVFTGLDKAVALSMNRVCSTGRETDKDDHELLVFRNEGEDDKLELLKALRLSQTRAREAEKKAAGLAKERERISNAFVKDSLQLFAYRQWVRLLEIQVSKLQSQLLKQERHCCDKPEGKSLLPEGNEGGNGDEMSWFVAFAVCLGIASVGFAFGYRYLL
ncbi:Uncharacterized protein TCM_001035 [Theobroma cacao]|uniref:Uncharacterized protein n=1 Tax=Theobroma cacao TaxID=3641 RepID=A0A061DPX5_THECC|nr:Uncharacterized protein TCM_001035 [Theobroma cacao]